MSNNQYPYNSLTRFHDSNRCRPLYGAITSDTINTVEYNNQILNPGLYFIDYNELDYLIHVPYRGKLKLDDHDKINLSAENGKYIHIIPYLILDTFQDSENITLENSIHAIFDGFNVLGRCERTIRTSINNGATSSPISSISLTIDNIENIIELPTVLRDLPNNIGIHDECIFNFNLQVQNLIIRVGRCVLGGLNFEVVENKSDENSTLLFAKYNAVGTCPTNEAKLWCSHLQPTTYNNIMTTAIYNDSFISLSRSGDDRGLYVRIPTTISSKRLSISYLHSRISNNPIIVEYPLNTPQYKVNLLKKYKFKTNYNTTSISIDNDVVNVMYKYMVRS